ncbi:hypothetical protein H5410_030129 [Solanum commersonii]|uniref:Uncharacterized protein n=1 Tax=Solanum commersonii TaxID=4109 RepID=A0A9J5YFZ8_SOLCO|nr:hypothetical protein H5410_030129 [Solanum commersonii]
MVVKPYKDSLIGPHDLPIDYYGFIAVIFGIFGALLSDTRFARDLVILSQVLMALILANTVKIIIVTLKNEEDQKFVEMVDH